MSDNPLSEFLCEELKKDPDFERQVEVKLEEMRTSKHPVKITRVSSQEQFDLVSTLTTQEKSRQVTLTSAA